MILIPIDGYGNFPLHNRLVLLTNPDAAPCIILSDEKLGYWGFIDRPEDLRTLHTWLTEKLGKATS
jgi:hypothetical protein